MENNTQIKTWHAKHRESRTIAQRIADVLANVAGSWPFVLIHAIWFFCWIVFKVEPFPYGLLTMIVSLEAIFLSSFILISQNRQSERDRIQALEDYQTNLEAKKEIEQVSMLLSRIETEKLDKILKILEEK